MISKLFINKTDNLLIQLMRYTFVGGLAFVADFASLYLFTEVANLHYLYSAAVAFLIGLSINYIISTLWIFKNRSINSKTIEFIFFASIGLIGLGLNELIIWFFTEHLQIYYLNSKLISTFIVYFWNFFARRFILFKGK